jgi:hypothetical protein
VSSPSDDGSSSSVVGGAPPPVVVPPPCSSPSSGAAVVVVLVDILSFHLLFRPSANYFIFILEHKHESFVRQVVGFDTLRVVELFLQPRLCC